MSQSQSEASRDDAGAGQGAAIELGSYEVIKARLSAHGEALREQANALNSERVEVFGGTEMDLSATERVRTENNCVPRDILAVGEHLWFGYNVYIGLRTETRVEDVFALQAFSVRDGGGLEFSDVPLEGTFLGDDRFQRDFRELYKYYKAARLVTMREVGSKLLAVFQIGDGASDVKVFRWGLSPQAPPTYIDNRGERDHGFPPAHDFEWTAVTREDQVTGAYPHVSILDEVFVETMGGELTVKIENNTESGEGVYSEPVEDSHQSLDDAKIDYVSLGDLIVLRVLPYRETVWRYLVFDRITHEVERLDAIGQSCRQLPEDHGIVFPGGFLLARQGARSFDSITTDGMQFEKQVRAPNGEDVMYVFHRPVDGLYTLLPYNLIRKSIDKPIQCHGWSLFDDGRLVVFRQTSEEPTRVHPMQVWNTAYLSDEVAAGQEVGDSFLERIGNAELVRGISDCLAVVKMTQSLAPTVAMYESIITTCARVADQHFWLVEPAAHNLATHLSDVRDAAELIVGEFQKVRELQTQARQTLGTAEREVEELFRSLRPDYWTAVDDFVDALSRLRTLRGQLTTMRELRYIDLERVGELETEIDDQRADVGKKTVRFLDKPESLEPYRARIAEIDAAVESASAVTEVKPLAQTLDEVSTGLDLLTEVVGGLAIDDAAVRTGILERISEVMAAQNRSRALLDARRRTLLSKEGRAEFAAQFALFSQSVTSALAMADTPDKCDHQLSRLMLQLEDLEGRFSEFDDYLEKLATRREEVYEAFETKKQQLLDERQRRASNTMRAAERILSGVARRAAGFGEVSELNAYFASDAMIAKVRELAERLRELQDSVRADEVLSRLKSAREDAVRALRDRQEIYEDGASIIKFGTHRFSVNTQALDLTLVPRDDGMALHLTGTDYYEPVTDEAFQATRTYWDQTLPSETKTVYRSEYLAYVVLLLAERGEGGLTLDGLHEAALVDDDLLQIVRQVAAERYDEGYDRGVHDVDAARILARLLSVHVSAGLLRFDARSRAAACLFWAAESHPELTERASAWRQRATSLGRLRAAFGPSAAVEELGRELAAGVAVWHEAVGLPCDATTAEVAGAYLFEELCRADLRFTTSGDAQRLKDGLFGELGRTGAGGALEADLTELEHDIRARVELADAWIGGWLRKEPNHPARYEAAALVALDGALPREVSSARTQVTVDGLLGQHSRVVERTLELRLDEFMARLTAFSRERVPGYRAYQVARHELLVSERARLRLDEFMPRVMSSFVRNRLINEVYLPIIGDNLSKQLGALGEGKRTDLMGLLLLISPPGYGKTTLMEYIASRLGLVFMKINGPALGHGVTSIDPSEAPNATARQEVEKINLALEMGNNVLLYLDDIQHTNPELLQKFISLCDAQRRIEGVWKGRTRTYDLRGKKFVVCMAGNPYTETGEKFQIPDMLSNRADAYNLGDILGGRDDVFALSYIENAMTSNRVLAQITTHEHKDIYKFVDMAKGREVPETDLAHPYSRVEIQEIVAVLKRLLRVQEVILAVNQEYIRSASMDDGFRTEPRFQLQGSYRNINRLAEKIVAVMNDAELEQLIDDHYLGEAQTLTHGAEHNLLKLAELRGVMSDEQTRRWDEIKGHFRRQKLMGGGDDDPVTRVTAQLLHLGEKVADIGQSIRDAGSRQSDAEPEREVPLGEELSEALAPLLNRVGDSISALDSAQRHAATSTSAPGAVHTLLEKQIEVVETTLVPLLRSMGHSLSTNKAMWDKMNEILQALKALDSAAVSAARATQDSPQPVAHQD